MIKALNATIKASLPYKKLNNNNKAIIAAAKNNDLPKDELP